MATTTNYAWDTPDDTDLVKDGAAAIRTLGSSIDTTTKALNPQTTTGAIAYRSATSNVNTSLPIGTAGQVLQVNSGATAPEWATFAGGGMTVIASGTLSGSTVNITSIPGTYGDLKLYIKNFDPSNDGEYCNLRFNGDTGSNYRGNAITTSAAQTVTTTQLNIGGGVNGGDDTVTTGLSVITIHDYANSTTVKNGTSFEMSPDKTTPTSFDLKTQHLCYKATTAITEFNLFPSAGTFSGGTYTLYGVK
jgi:hypothetical protein